jgi:hypothetical protein
VLKLIVRIQVKKLTPRPYEPVMLEFTIHYSKFTIPPQAASRAGGYSSTLAILAAWRAKKDLTQRRQAGQ